MMNRNQISSTHFIVAFLLVFFAVSYAAAQVSNQLDTGYPENGIFHGSDIENVQVNNGGLHVEIPIYSAKGRGLSVGAKVVYNSKGWTFLTRCFTSGGGFCEDDVQGDPLGYPTLAFFGAFDYAFSTGSSLCTTGGFPDLSYNTLGGYTLREPDGTKHHFVPDPLIGLSGCVPPQYPATVYADDGSGWIMNINTSDGTIIEAISKNGTRILPPSGSAATRVAAALIVDANGNQMSSSATCCTSSGWGGTDTLGRTIPADGAYYDSTGTLQSSTFGGSTSVAIDTTSLCLFSNADTCFPKITTWTLPTQLQLPNGDIYTFTYAQNAGGELASMTLPTGGQISWTWGNWDEGGRNVATRTVSANGVTGQWKYDFGAGTAIVTDPANKDTRYTCGAICLKVEYFDGPADSSPLIKTVSTDYLSYGFGLTGYSLPIRETTTWNQLNLVMKTETDWDSMAISGVGTVTWRNPIEKRVFDWGTSTTPGPLLQRTHYSYRHLEGDGGFYLAANIADLPTLVQTYDGAGNLLAQTLNSYDGSSLAGTGTCAVPGVPNHDYCSFGAANLVRGNLTQVSRWLNTSNTWLPTNNTYDDLGNVRSTTDPGGHPTTFDYTDSWGGTGCVTAASTLAFPTTVTNALGHRAKTSYYPCTSLAQSMRDENDIRAGRTGKTFTYDLLNRPLVTEALDTGGQILAKTSVSYNDLSIPLSITKTVTATPDPDIISTVYMDGLGRTLQTQLNDPEGNVSTEATYDKLGRKHSVTNPHRSVPALTDGSTQFVYDALGRTTDVIKPDGNSTHTDYAGNVTTVTDETGRQRRNRGDGLGRLVEVDEPGDAFAGTASGGTLTINGTLRSTVTGGSPATQATGSVTVWGTEQSIYVDGGGGGCPPPPMICLVSDASTMMHPPDLSEAFDLIFDFGNVSVTVNGHQDQTTFGQGDTAASIATRLAGVIRASSPYVDYTSVVTNSTNPPSATINLISRTAGSATNYSLATSYTYDNFDFATPSFTTTKSGNNFTGGADAVGGTTVYDSGTVTVTVGTGFTASAPYSQTGNSTAAFVAAALAGTGATGLNRSGSPVHATVSGANITLTYNTAGVSGNVSVAAASSPSNGTLFPGGSFSGSTSLSGGQDPYPSSLAHPYVTLYSYDGLGNLSCVEQHGNVSGTGCSSDPSLDAASPWRVRRFTYDSLSRILTAKNPESGTVTYQYDADSNVISKTDVRGVTVNFAPTGHPLDPLHRVTQKAYVGTTDPPVSYTYDTATEGVGRIATASTTNGSGATVSTSFNYDPLGRINQQANCLPSGTCTSTSNQVTASYDAAGSLTSLGYPGGRTVSAAYNAAGRMIAVKLGAFNYYAVPQSTLASNWGYWPTGAMNRGTYGNGVVETTGYNTRLQLDSIADVKGSTTLFSKRYVYYDAASQNNGNILSINDTLSSTRNQTYSYDGLNRIITGAQADNAFNITYSYDPWGNMRESGTSNFLPVYDVKNRIQQPANCNPVAQYCYDPAGDLLRDNQNHVYTYDAEARIKTVDGTVATYTYGGDGNRVRKDANGVATEYVYFGSNVIAEKNPSTGAWTDYIFGYGGRRIAKETSTNGSGAQYYQDDHLGTTRVMTDSAGTVIYNCTFNPFGEQAACSPDNPSNHYRFTGKERDSEDGLDDFGARYFSSSMGRWMTPDWSERPTAVPYANFGDPQSLNLYLYVRNDPVSLADADGHATHGEGSELCMLGIPGGCSGAALSLSFTRQEIKSGCGFWCHTKQRFSNLIHGFGFLTNDGVEKMIHKDDLLLRSFGINPEGMTDKQIMHKADQILADIDVARELHSNHIIVNGTMFILGSISKYPTSSTESPGPGWEWRGKGPVGSERGSWYNPNTGESLHPDLNHPDPIGPHYDYIDSNGNKFRYYPDGRLEPK